MEQSITEYIEDLNDWRKQHTPLDSQYVKWTKDANGMTANINREAIIDGINASGGVSPYSGFFCVKYFPSEDEDLDVPGEYWMVDGSDIYGDYAGFAKVNSQEMHCESMLLDGVVDRDKIYVHIYFDIELGEYTYEYSIFGNLEDPPVVIGDEWYVLIAVVRDYPDGDVRVRKITQVWESDSIEYTVTEFNGAFAINRIAGSSIRVNSGIIHVGYQNVVVDESEFPLSGLSTSRIYINLSYSGEYVAVLRNGGAGIPQDPAEEMNILVGTATLTNERIYIQQTLTNTYNVTERII